ncbi:MAG: hypothetical protein BMS9Abin32_273 [Gammaproteobacteria bacterium]|nr:MAG: hypothetical protein BMS9Abin32_273 [Gammaproteobacteria bacterium]
MDELERRLKRDADEIEAEISPAFQARLDASLQGAGRLRPQAAQPRPATATLWWASSLTGLAVATLVIVLLNWNRERPETRPVEVARDLPTLPQPLLPMHGRVPLRIRTADLTMPLEQELLHLQEDIEKARDRVERDLRSTF